MRLSLSQIPSRYISASSIDTIQRQAYYVLRPISPLSRSNFSKRTHSKKSVMLNLHSLHFHAVIIILISIPRAVGSPTAAQSERVESRLREALEFSSQQTKVLVKRYASSFNLRQAPAMMVLYLRAVAFDTLAQIDDSSNRAVFDICVQGPRHRSAVLYHAQALFHAIQVAAERKGKNFRPIKATPPLCSYRTYEETSTAVFLWAHFWQK